MNAAYAARLYANCSPYFGSKANEKSDQTKLTAKKAATVTAPLLQRKLSSDSISGMALMSEQGIADSVMASPSPSPSLASPVGLSRTPSLPLFPSVEGAPAAAAHSSPLAVALPSMLSPREAQSILDNMAVEKRIKEKSDPRVKSFFDSIKELVSSLVRFLCPPDDKKPLERNAESENHVMRLEKQIDGAYESTKDRNSKKCCKVSVSEKPTDEEIDDFLVSRLNKSFEEAIPYFINYLPLFLSSLTPRWALEGVLKLFKNYIPEDVQPLVSKFLDSRESIRIILKKFDIETRIKNLPDKNKSPKQYCYEVQKLFLELANLFREEIGQKPLPIPSFNDLFPVPKKDPAPAAAAAAAAAPLVFIDPVPAAVLAVASAVDALPAAPAVAVAAAGAPAVAPVVAAASSPQLRAPSPQSSLWGRVTSMGSRVRDFAAQKIATVVFQGKCLYPC